MKYDQQTSAIKYKKKTLDNYKRHFHIEDEIFISNNKMYLHICIQSMILYLN